MDKANTVPVLYSSKDRCCGCGACLNICPRHAIAMKEDESGFLYPEIREDLCVRCGLCKKVCAFQNRQEESVPLACCAAVNKDKETLKYSASGGVFHALALDTLEKGGLVYGAAFTDTWTVCHIAGENRRQIGRLQGSKYAHSDTGWTFSEAKKMLEKGRLVLFSGTPCQIAGFKAFLGRDYDNLLMVDIVCHGVPSSSMLQKYIGYLEEKWGRSVTAFTFRDKSLGWGINGSAAVKGEANRKKLWQSESAYLYYFLKGWIYRENCYVCKYASSHRPADLTIGDFWGIEKQHPEYLGRNGWDESKGISFVFASTAKGEEALEGLQRRLDMKPATFDEIAAGNGQLRHPSEKGPRDEILAVYREGGWDALEKRFLDKVGLKRHSSFVKSLIPSGIKRAIKSRKRQWE